MSDLDIQARKHKHNHDLNVLSISPLLARVTCTEQQSSGHLHIPFSTLLLVFYTTFPAKNQDQKVS